MQVPCLGRAVLRCFNDRSGFGTSSSVGRDVTVLLGRLISLLHGELCICINAFIVSYTESICGFAHLLRA